MSAVAMPLGSVVRAQPRDLKLVATLIGALPPPNRYGLEWSAAIEQGLAEHGWVVGDTIEIEHRFTAGEPELTARYANELFAMQPDIFVTGTSENSVAAHILTKTIPIVFVFVIDPIAVGLVESIPQPGANVSGISHLPPSIGGRYVDVLLELAPTTTRVFWFTNPDTGVDPTIMRPFAAEAAALHGVAFEDSFVRSIDEIRPAVAMIASNQGSGLVLPLNNWIHNNTSEIVDAINSHQLPAVYPADRMVEGGGLIGIGVDGEGEFYRAGLYAGRVLNGADPATLPVLSMTPTITINLATAAAQGITIPLTLQAAANTMIE